MSSAFKITKNNGLIFSFLIFSNLAIATDNQDKTAVEYYSTFEKVDVDQYFASPSLQTPKYMGYESADRISKEHADSDRSVYYTTVSDEEVFVGRDRGRYEVFRDYGKDVASGASGLNNYGLENQIDAKIIELRKEAEYYDTNSSSQEYFGSSTEEMLNNYQVQQQRYQQEKELAQKSKEWDEKRLEEINNARAIRAEATAGCDEGGSRYGSSYCIQAAQVSQNERYEMEDINDRLTVKNYWDGFSAKNSGDSATAEQENLFNKYKNADGTVDVERLVATEGKKIDDQTIIPQALFCLMDVGSALATPECKRPVCKLLGKWTCKAMGF